MSVRNNQHRDLLLMEYASGSLDEAESLLAASLASMCKQARAHLDMCEQVGAAMLEQQCSPVNMRENSLQNVLDRLEENICEDSACKQMMAEVFGELQVPEPVREYMVIREYRPKWQKLALGLDLCKIPMTSNSRHAYLMRMVPGVPVTARVRSGTEYILILQGSIRDRNDIHREGDLILRETGVVHQFIADPDAGCLVFIVTENAPPSRNMLSQILEIFRGR